jgi:GST-like protein
LLVVFEAGKPRLPGLSIDLPNTDTEESFMTAKSIANDNQQDYVPPTVWTPEKPSGGQFANINRPVSGATHEKDLPRGRHPLQLYSLGTPNGVKVTIKIGDGDQFGSGFVALNPNSKIPAMLDCSTSPPTRLFESGSILFYLAEKFGALLPEEHYGRAETMNWLMWQMGSAPYLGGGFGHFYAYAPLKIEYAINRFAMETKRLLHVLDTQLGKTQYIAGDGYSIADIAIWPWYGAIMSGTYNAREFLSTQEYHHVARWMDLVGSRPAVQRGRRVNSSSVAPELRVTERHSAVDFGSSG